MKKDNVELDSIKNPKMAIMIMIFSLLFLVIGLVLSKVNLTHYSNFNVDKNSIFKNVYVEITDLPIEFQVNYKGKVQDFYIVRNENNKYIVKLTQKQYNRIQEQYKENIQNFKYCIKGKSYSSFENLEKEVLKIYEKKLENEIVNSTNYVDHFGESFVDATEGNVSNIMSSICYMLAALFIFIAIIVVVHYIQALKKFNKTISLYGREEIEKEINSPESIIFKNAGICLAKKYIVSTALDFNIIQYDNIYWIYILKKRINFITITKCIMAATKEGKILPIACEYNEKNLNEIIDKIHEKNNSILIGYSRKNRASFQKYLRKTQ